VFVEVSKTVECHTWTFPVRFSLRLAENDVLSRQRTTNALERELTHLLDLQGVLDFRQHPMDC
jgi:hypothetical protein